MDLKQYLTEAEKQYHLRLKTIVPLDDGIMDRIENYLAKYQPLNISRPNKTILQREPLDFPNVDAAEVYIVDMSFGLPAAPHVIRADLRKLLDAPENYVFVRNRQEPGEIESDRLNALADIELEATKRGLKPMALLNDPDYDEAEHDHQNLYGTDYNAELLKYLETVEDERHKMQEVVDNAPFKWLPLSDQDTSNFNEHVKDAPFVKAPSGTADVRQSMLGSFDQSRATIRRTYTDGSGKKVVLSRTLGSGEK
jgi:hypothetical protein